ncbi:hypothetical protein GWI33_003624 [Rhynchophorus ferrugineus]|uniref:AB hydrolase-1 domain-containing protein n=1 Tax=Rhynchophorus ferrugineus TaxID=354439 RepID=A0A834HM71_RHYFE|nr:hypothetical protein GWI33_003624 [Rhynchophorus ferrugineus]
MIILGYDVWLANSRANTYSMRHETLKPTDPKFWDFSFHEKGYYDLPACIDHILNVTGKTKLTFIGYSQGTTEAMVLTSTKPEYNDKINVMIFLSPVGYVKNVRSPVVHLVRQHQELFDYLRQLQIYGMPWNRWLSKLTEITCNDVSPLQNICISILQLIFGFDIPQIDRSLLTVLLSTTPAGFSFKELIHFGQEISSGQFQQFDYGEKNMEIYGAPVAPAYDVSKITCPVVAYYGMNDFLASVEDVEKLLDEFPGRPERKRIPYELFNHIDFVFAKDAKVLVYDSVIDICNKYNTFFNFLQ